MKLNIALFIVATFVLTACSASTNPSVTVPDDKLAEIQARGTLIIATDPDYTPQSKLLPDVQQDPNT